MTSSKKKYFKGRHLAAFSGCIVFPLLSHWFFQGLLYLDRTERFYKLAFDLLGTILFGWIFSLALPLPGAVLAGFGLVHTLNFFLNGQLWAVVKFFYPREISAFQFMHKLRLLSHRARREPSIDMILVLGSLARQDLRTTSDLDLRILRKPGFINGLRACTFQMKERSRALFEGFPLDTYVVDSRESLLRQALREPGVDLYELLDSLHGDDSGQEEDRMPGSGHE